MTLTESAIGTFSLSADADVDSLTASLTARVCEGSTTCAVEVTVNSRRRLDGLTATYTSQRTFAPDPGVTVIGTAFEAAATAAIGVEIDTPVTYELAATASIVRRGATAESAIDDTLMDEAVTAAIVETVEAGVDNIGEVAISVERYAPPPPPPRPPPPPGGFRPPKVETKSDAEQLALARHLQQTGAKFYGAYWCGFCGKQRTLFGAEATAALPYVECAADGFQSDTALCRSKPEVTGYPAWEINGKFYGGLRSLEELGELSKFDAAKSKSKTATAANALGVELSPDAVTLKGGPDCDLKDADCK